jgi:Fe-S cluster biogenesis protein NfuA
VSQLFCVKQQLPACRLELPSQSATYYNDQTNHSPAPATGQEPAMFIQTEATPNPATLKFLPGRTVLAHGTLDIRDSAAAAQSPLAERLFGIDGISGVFLGADFIAVTKSEGEWQQLKPAILGAVMEHFVSGAPMLHNEAPTTGQATDEFFEAKDVETVTTIKELIETRVRPAVANDGGDITFRGFKDGVVYLDMKGACSGCPSSTATLRHGIQNLLRHYLPDVVEVRPMS